MIQARNTDTTKASEEHSGMALLKLGESFSFTEVWLHRISSQMSRWFTAFASSTLHRILCVIQWLRNQLQKTWTSSSKDCTKHYQLSIQKTPNIMLQA